VTWEREAKLSVGPSFRLPDLSDLHDGIEALPPTTKTLNTLYLDTEDLRLARWGCSLRFREGEGWTVKLPPIREGDLLVRGEHTFPGTRSKAPEEAVELLRAYLRSAELAPVARLRTVRTTVALRAPDGSSAGEVVDDEVSVLDGSRVAARFREVEVEVAEGSVGALLDAALARLHAAGAGDTGFTPKYVRAMGPRAELPPELVPLAPTDPSVVDLVRATLTRSTIYLLRNDAEVRLGENPEALHEGRVATRRLRSRLRTFRPVLDPSWAASLRAELGWLAAELGAVRDADVLEAVLRDSATGLPPADRAVASLLLERLQSQREAYLQELRGAMSSGRYVALLDSLVDAALEPAVLAQAADMPASSLGSVMEGPWSLLERACHRLGDHASDADMHRVRILAKRVRYTAESLTPAFGGQAEAMADAAARLQEVLGDQHDAVLASAWLREAASHVDPQVAFVAGLMSARERRVAARIRGSWRREWKKLDRPRHRFWR
jgi:CHAD domain-containing protein